MKHLFTADEIAAVEKANHIAQETGVPVDRLFQIEDFSDVLASVVHERLAALDEPVFTNPTTGKAASSVHAVLDALD